MCAHLFYEANARQYGFHVINGYVYLIGELSIFGAMKW